MVLTDDQIAFFRTIPASRSITVSLPLALGMILASVGIVYYDQTLWTYFNSSENFRLAIVVLWLGLTALGFFIPLYLGTKKISRMDAEELEQFIKDKSERKSATVKGWDEVESATLLGQDQVEIFLVNNGGSVKAKLKQVYLQQEISTDVPRSILSSTQPKLQNFLSQKLGERLQAIDERP